MHIKCSGQTPACLLIVPYGIETTNGEAIPLDGRLLIVPYGIETNLRLQQFPITALPFNRTLWN